jgi:hypothetical protein
MTSRLLLASATAALALHGLATAQSIPTLSEARKAVRDAATPGVVIIPARAPASAVAATSGASAPARSGSFLGDVARTLPPPSGRSIDSARRLDAPDVGIALPSRGASAPGR